jgi:PAS domain S-box-containing protein
MPVARAGPSDPLLELLDALPDAVVVTERAAPHRIEWIGGAYQQLTSWEPDAARGRPLAELCTHESSVGAFERLLRAVGDGETADARMRIRCPDGRVEAMAVRVLQLPALEGVPARVAWLARPDADRALGRIDAAVYSYLLDEQDRADLIYTSPRFEALVGTAPTAMAPIDAWRARIHPDDRTIVEESIARLRSGHMLEREYRLMCADGKERFVLDRATPQGPEDGILTVDGILIDVTERRQAALAFAETSSRLAHVIESIDEYL